MIIHREIRSSYHHKPIVQGCTTPSLSWRRWRSRWRRWRPRRQRPAGVSPLQSATPGLCFVVSVFRRRSRSRKSWGSIYSRFYVKMKLREERSTAAEARGPVWWVPRGQGIWPRGPPLSAFWSPFLRFLCAYVSFLPKK